MSPISPTTPGPSSTGPDRSADSPEKAARQFESVLVRQFVEVMTKDLFDGEQEGMLTGQADLQRDTLTDTLTEHLVESGTFGIADLMMAQWKQSGRLPSAPTADSSGAPIENAAPNRALSMDDALRLYPPAQAPPRSIDNLSDDLP